MSHKTRPQAHTHHGKSTLQTMASSKVAAALAEVASMPELEKAAGYERMLQHIKDLSHPRDVAADLKAITSSMMSASLGVMSTRTLLGFLATTLRDLKNSEMCITVGNYAVGLIGAGGDSSASASNFVDQVAALREIVASAHEAQDEFSEAARALAEIPLDSSQRKVSNREMARIWVRIVRNYLEVDDTAAAEMYINKLKNIMHTVSSEDAELGLHFQLSQARIEDSKRGFLSAAKRYHEISLSAAIAEEERLQTLSAAIKCGILAPAGPLRSRLLGRLYRDERSEQLPEFSILEKIFFDRLLTTKEVDKFAESLAPHQLAVTSDGSTVLTRAIIEHNLLGASRLYANITFEALGKLLGLGADKAEETTARMIEQGRLVGRMDQVDGVVWFEKGEASGVKGSGRAEVLVGKETRRWDANVQGISEEVESVVNALQHEFPVRASLIPGLFPVSRSPPANHCPHRASWRRIWRLSAKSQESAHPACNIKAFLACRKKSP
jgi:COP9 signalosome complex subunit 4